VPSCSSGFCVAITRRFGPWFQRAAPPAPSAAARCIGLEQRRFVLGGVRFISSASSSSRRSAPLTLNRPARFQDLHWQNVGPRDVRRHQFRRNWSAGNTDPIAPESVLTTTVLATPALLHQACPAREDSPITAPRSPLLPDDHLPQLVLQSAIRLGARNSRAPIRGRKGRRKENRFVNGSHASHIVHRPLFHGQIQHGQLTMTVDRSLLGTFIPPTEGNPVNLVMRPFSA